jgi:hypothetical protein
MSGAGQIDFQCFEKLIRQLRADSHAAAAEKLDTILHRVAWTTGSELLGALGLEIAAFQRATPEVSAELQATLASCMQMVKRVWPHIK